MSKPKILHSKPCGCSSIRFPESTQILDSYSEPAVVIFTNLASLREENLGGGVAQEYASQHRIEVGVKLLRVLDAVVRMVVFPEQLRRQRSRLESHDVGGVGGAGQLRKRRGQRVEQDELLGKILRPVATPSPSRVVDFTLRKSVVR